MRRVRPIAMSLVAVVATAAAPQRVTIDTAALGPAFDGLGGVSAGTGPRLLVDYEEPTRSHILDLLFKPNFGASMQILKVEIGGTGDSTQGTEASHEPQRGLIVPDAGYELWLAREARKRNPSITLYGLAWDFPDWVAEGTAGFGTRAAHYLVDWLKVARDHHHLDVDIIGWQNEHVWADADVVEFRSLMDESGFASVELAVADCGPGPGFQTPNITERIKSNAALDAAAAIVGHHYPVSIMPVAKNRSFYENLWTLRQKLWSSEEYSTYSDTNGARCLAKLFNRNYIDANLTASLVWDMMWSSFDGLACAGDGLMWAAEPWSGVYGAMDTVWMMAHTTQFTSGGGNWRYLLKPNGAGYLPKPEAPAGTPSFWGSYVGLVNGDTGGFTLVVETMDNADSTCSYGNSAWERVQFTDAQERRVQFCLSPCVGRGDGGAPPKLTFFASTIGSNGSTELPRFEAQEPVELDADCCFVTSMRRNSIQTFSTTKSAKKGGFANDTLVKPPERISNGCGPFAPRAGLTDFPLPYHTAFGDRGAVRFQDFPVFLSDVEGVFRVNRSTGLLEQRVLAPSSRGVPHGQEPTTVLGDKTWSDYTVTSKAKLPAKSHEYVGVYARFGNAFSFQSSGGYALRLYGDGAWNMTVRHANDSESSLARGHRAAPLRHGADDVELALTVEGSSISGAIDGTRVGRATNGEWKRGLAGLGCGYHVARFSTFGVAKQSR